VVRNAPTDNWLSSSRIAAHALYVLLHAAVWDRDFPQDWDAGRGTRAGMEGLLGRRAMMARGCGAWES